MNLKKRLKNGEVVFGTFVKFPSPQMVEMLGYAGLDFVILDMEHSLISFTEAENLMRAAAVSGMDVIVRVPSAQEEHVLHALDAGAQGVQVPGLTTAEEAAEVISWGKYYPHGVRGLSFAQRSARFGFIQDKDQYIREKNEESLFSIHIENKEMVGEIDKLCQNPYADVLFVGPMDMSQSYGVPGNPGSPDVQAAVRKVADAAKGSEKAAGIFVTGKEAMDKYIDMGMQYIVYASDQAFCASGTRAYMDMVKQYK